MIKPFIQYKISYPDRVANVMLFCNTPYDISCQVSTNARCHSHGTVQSLWKPSHNTPNAIGGHVLYWHNAKLSSLLERLFRWLVNSNAYYEGSSRSSSQTRQVRSEWVCKFTQVHVRRRQKENTNPKQILIWGSKHNNTAVSYVNLTTQNSLTL